MPGTGRHLLWTAALLPASLWPAMGAAQCASPLAKPCPEIAYQTVTIPIRVYKPQVQQKTVTVVREEVETRLVSRLVTELVPEVRVHTETYTECTPAWEEVAEEVTVLVPETEIREGVRTFAVPAMSTETRKLRRDAGRWVCESVVDRHGCRRTRTEWMPKIVCEDQPIALCKLGVVSEPCRYEATTYKPKSRTVTRRICKPVYETKTREIPYTVCVPRQVERQCAETICRPVVEEQVVNCLVTVAETQHREILVPICPSVTHETVRPESDDPDSDIRHCRSY